MKKQKKFRRIHKSAKILGALFLGALAVSGGVLAMPTKSHAISKGEVLAVAKTLTQSDPGYIDKWNNEFSSIYTEFDKKLYLDSFKSKEAMNEGTVIEAMEKKDYETWKEATQNLEGYPVGLETIPEEEFDILADLRKTL